MATDQRDNQSRKGRRQGPAKRRRKGDTRIRSVRIIRQVWDDTTQTWRHERIDLA